MVLEKYKDIIYVNKTTMIKVFEDVVHSSLKYLSGTFETEWH